MDVSGADCLRKELRTVLGILERRKPWHPFSTPTALVAHARQLMGALHATTPDGARGDECHSFEQRLQNARVTMRSLPPAPFASPHHGDEGRRSIGGLRQEAMLPVTRDEMGQQREQQR